MTSDAAALLAAYDAQLRGEVEMSAPRTERLGPLFAAVRPERGYVTYRDLGGAIGADVDALIERVIAFYRDETDVRWFEWKLRGHDKPSDLAERLRAHGFEPEDEETLLAGSIDGILAAAGPLPDGVTIRRVEPTDLPTIIQARALQAHVFGRAFGTAEEDSERLVASQGKTSLWVAEAAEEAAKGEPWGGVVCAGRIDVVPGTEFAGVWGGAALEHWRGHGIYRALTAARAAHARTLGARFVQSDSTPYSAPILERAGLVVIGSTTPYIWRR